MTVLNSVHHINFIVADLDVAVQAYQSKLGLGSFEYEELPDRGVSTARILIGGVWIILVSPRSKDSLAARYLEAHGEGFFLMSFGVDNLQQAMAELARRGAEQLVPVYSTGRLPISRLNKAWVSDFI